MAETRDWGLLAGPATITETAWDGSGLFYTSIDDNEIRRYEAATGDIYHYRDTGAPTVSPSVPMARFTPAKGKAGACPLRDRRCQDDVGRPLRRSPLNSPNDLALDRAGRIWFTDPRYGDDHSDRELDHDSVYRITPPEGVKGHGRSSV